MEENWFKEQAGLKKILVKYRKIPKISPGAYIFQRPFLRGLFLEGLICGAEICVSKSIQLGRKFTIFALFYFVFEGNFQVEAPGGHIDRKAHV